MEDAIKALWWETQSLLTALTSEEKEFSERWSDEIDQIKWALSEAQTAIWPELKEEKIDEHRTSASEDGSGDQS